MGAPTIHSTARSPTQAELLARQGRAPLLPAVEVQEDAVAEIEAYQEVVDGALAVLDNYRPGLRPDRPRPTASGPIEVTRQSQHGRSTTT